MQKLMILRGNSGSGKTTIANHESWRKDTACWFMMLMNFFGRTVEEYQISQKPVKPYGYQFHYMNTLLMVDIFLPNFEINEENRKRYRKPETHRDCRQRKRQRADKKKLTACF